MAENTWKLALLSAEARILGPLTRGAEVVTNDAVDLPFEPRAVHIGTAGTMRITIGGVTINSSYEAGWHPFTATRIHATGTLAAAITIWD
jgi:hypothetical protein